MWVFQEAAGVLQAGNGTRGWDAEQLPAGCAGRLSQMNRRRSPDSAAN
ncbi:hypothetical protein CLOSTASPAR_00042 [[Clostridium] asparagiforme DSM 15981]|uniref:Uncharacterized protein n=1 Tax=[Clostridium] asparagiforme DSM 15981 TaxID=518636 RepID=C0CSU8_9FIRM|nr:hypothetical protein CLOSTASPAR_00042 [[Clostridium] asparagiforme DSM 15981]